MITWLKNLPTVQKIALGALVILGVAGGYWIFNRPLPPFVTSSVVFQRFFGGSYEGFIQEWDEAVEISSGLNPKETPEPDLTGANCAAAVNAAIPEVEAVVADFDRILADLDKFDQQISEAEAAANGLADSKARSAASKLVKYAKDWSVAFRDFLPPSKRALGLKVDQLKAVLNVGCGTEESIVVIFNSLEQIGAVLNGPMTGYLAKGETIAADSAAAHQEFQEATGVTVRPIGSLSREQLENLLQE